MHIFSAIMIFICFKEIYSWNSAANLIFLSTLLPNKCFSYNLRVMKRSGKELYVNSTNNAASAALLKISRKSNSDVSNHTRVTSNNGILPELTNTSIHSVLNASVETPLPRTKEVNSFTTPISSKTTIVSTEVPENISVASNLYDVENVTNSFVNSSSSNVTVVPTILPTNSTVDDDRGSLHPFHYILIVCAVIAVILLIAYGIYHMYRKEQVRRLRLQLMPVYNFDPTESDDWENNLLEEEFTLRSRDKEKSTVVTAGAIIDVGETLRQPRENDQCEPPTQL
ncbi:hypothetical protein Anas_08673 [Armadillidium nasatum]|uniref:Uncharacterized protein n=2 Tax=Armadillidium nasatum TaxID=96803 RepID=A0A5N5T4N2_9CRUS|nr:hypothetical protein Anas_08673 [Armadillidium nasatum]